MRGEGGRVRGEGGRVRGEGGGGGALVLISVIIHGHMQPTPVSVYTLP